MILALHVKDMEKSLAFYSTLLGLSVLRRHSPGEGREMVFLGEDGKPRLELILTGEGATYAGFSIGFPVDDLAGIKERLARHGYPVTREVVAGPDTTLCFLEGPNGEQVELIADAATH